jgi:hypothetical protein
MAVSVYDAGGRFVRTLGEYPGGDFVINYQGDRYTSMAADLPRRMQLAVGGGKVAVTSQHRFEIMRYGSDGRLEMIVRSTQEPTAVDGRIRSLYVNDPLSGIPDSQREAVRRARQNATFPETLPALGRVALDQDANLWVEEYVAPWEPDSRRPVWWVFSPAGQLIATTSLPQRFVPHQVRSDVIVGSSIGEFDVQYLQAHPLVRGR